jgi:hypothetical protein
MIKESGVDMMPTEKWAILKLLSLEHVRKGVFCGLAECKSWDHNKTEIRYYAHTPASEGPTGGSDVWWTAGVN